MNHKKELTLSISCFLLAFLCSMIWLKDRQENLAASISPGILRFHILANSNSSKDQDLKLEVKSLIINALSESGADSKESFCDYVTGHQTELESLADHYITMKGYSYKTQISITNCYFPTKSYGDITLPCGTYDAVQVKLGEARGRNWWCVLYPRLCFIDATHAVLPDDSKEQLKAILSPEAYEAILRPEARESAPPPDTYETILRSCPEDIHIGFRSIETVRKILAGSP